jgi:hypothetical protein
MIEKSSGKEEKAYRPLNTQNLLQQVLFRYVKVKGQVSRAVSRGSRLDSRLKSQWPWA